jgi:hypothetical protein
VSRIFGDVRQNGYVVPDIGAAIEHWSRVLGVGPFFYFEQVPIEQFCFRGEPSPVQVSIALSNSGPLQIELIEQRNDAPSMYREFLAREPRGGLQHVAYWTRTFDADMDRYLAADYQVAQSGQIGADGRFVYLDCEAHPGTVVEVSEISGAKGRFFERIAERAAEWDGRDSIQRR